MSHNQSRAEKSDGQLRKSGGRSGHNGGFYGSGGGKSGGGGGAAPPSQLSSSSNQPSLSSNRSFKKSGNGQGGQSRINPVNLGSETSAATATSRAVQNGAHGQPLSHGLQISYIQQVQQIAGSSTTPMPSGPKQGDAPVPRTSRAVPKAPPSQSSAGISDSAAPSTPVKGDGTKPFALQFGTISPGIVNGLQIPARTSSAPPNLDEQKRDQARHDSFRAVPTQPISSGPKQQLPTSRKDVVGVGQSTSAESHPPVQVKWDIHQQIPTVPVATPPKSAALPVPGISMAMAFQQQPIPMQFGGPGPQQMPMTLPIGNTPQVPQQMFVHNLQSHPLQPQAMIHQGLGFGPQISHQLGPQLGNLGIGIAAPQFAQQQQQPGKFGGPRKTAVKITHPETHEELRLDKRTDSYTDGASSGQRHPNNATPQSQPIASFTPSHYFPQLQAGSYNPSPIFFPPTTSVTTGSQPPRFSYPVGQSGQAISFVNSSLLNPMPGKSQPPLRGPSEPIKSEPFLVTVPSAPTQGSVKPTSVPSGPKVGGPSVTISMPVSKAEEPKFLKPPGEATLVRQQRDGQVSTESSFQHPETFTQSSGTIPLTASGGHLSGVASVVTQRALPGTSFAPATPSAEPGPVAVATDGKKGEPVRRSDSLKDHQKKSSKKELRSSQQQQQTDESASVTTTNLSSVKISKGGCAEDVNSMQLAEGTEHIYQSSRADISTTTTSSAYSSPENSVSTEARTGQEVESNAIPAESGSSGVIMKEAPQDVPASCSDSRVMHSSDGISIQEKCLLKVSSSSGREMDENIAGDLDSAVSHINNAFAKVECIKKMPEESEDGKSEVSEIPMLDSITTKVHPVLTIAKASEDVKPVVLVKQEDSETNNSEKLIETGAERQLISVDVERKLDVIDGLAPTSSEPQKTACNNEETPLSSHPVKNELETTCSHNVGSTVPGSSPPEAVVVVEAPVTFERINKSGANIMEVPDEGPTPSVTSGPKDKFASESTKAKHVTGRKKKRKEILSKADAAGASDLYNAYKGPEEKHQLASTTESVDSSLTVDGKNAEADILDKDVVANEEDGQSRGEVDDWEDAADVSTPKLENGKEVNEANKHPDDDGSEATGTKKYTRDFLLTFSGQCTDLPVGFEIGSDIADALTSIPLGSSHVVERDHYSSPGRVTDRSPGISRVDRRGIGLPNDDRWIKTPIPLHDIRADVGQNFRPGQGVNHGVLRNPRGHPSNQFVPILSGPMQSLVPQGGLVRNNSDADRWGRYISRGIMPPPQTPLQVMHKADRKYEIGKVSDEEQGKQRQLKAILNKLTPQNFEKLFQQVKEVNIDNTVTLSGVIAQIFDKALMEPTFCEMYANFCFHLSGELPDFVENDEKINFKRLLLNKCQEEFERGEREQAEANRVEEEGEIKQSDEEREEKRIKARRRMLGNIRLIGELYKKKMLTERIMHECIRKLLGQCQNPDEEDLESLCKLMSTIGDQIDHAKAKEHMDVYFDMMLKLSTNQKLSSRVRFMLRDVIDLRKNRWQQRRKVEGPKKIEEVHRDAAQERQSQTSRLTRGLGMNSAPRRGPPVDYGPRGAVLPSPSSQIGGIRGLPTQTRGYVMQDVRLEERHPLENRTLSLPLTQRPTEDSSITLGTQAGLARGMSIRGQPAISTVPLAETPLGIGDDRRMTSGPNGYSSTPDRIPYRSREDVASRYMPDRLSESLSDQPTLHDRNAYVGSRESKVADRSFDRFTPTTVPAGRTQGSSGGSSRAASGAKLLPEEVLREKSMSTIREFYSAKNEEEVALCIKELNSPSFYPSMVSLWVTDSFEKKDMERDLLAKLLVNLCNSRELSQVQLTQGFESVLSTLEDAVNDAPRAAEFLGRIFVKVILENVIPLRDIGKLIHESGEEPGSLVESGLASDVLGIILETIKTEKGDSILNEVLTSAKLLLEDFISPHPSKSKKLDAFLGG